MRQANEQHWETFLDMPAHAIHSMCTTTKCSTVPLTLALSSLGLKENFGCFGCLCSSSLSGGLALPAHLRPFELSDCCVQQIKLPLVPIWLIILLHSLLPQHQLSSLKCPSPLGWHKSHCRKAHCCLYSGKVKWCSLQHVNDSIEETSILQYSLTKLDLQSIGSVLSSAHTRLF